LPKFKFYERAKGSTLNQSGKTSVLATFEVLKLHLNMPPTEPAAGGAPPTSTTLREEVNVFFKSGKLAQGNYASLNHKITC
jgi:hypothetical protein